MTPLPLLLNTRTIFDGDVLAFDVAHFLEALKKPANVLRVRLG